MQGADRHAIAMQVLRFMELCGRGRGYGQNARPLQQLGPGRQLELLDVRA
jgi:hypothetical protein